MSFYLIIISALLGIVYSFGILVFQINIIFFKRNELGHFTLLAMFFSIVLTVLFFNLGSIPLKFLNEKHFFIALNILNQVMMVLTLRKLIRNKEVYYPVADRKLRSINRFLTVVYCVSAIVYYILFYALFAMGALRGF